MKSKSLFFANYINCKDMLVKSNIILIYLSGFCLLFIFSTKSFSQVYKENVTIQGSYNPTVSDAYKVNKNPEIPDETIDVPNLSYEINTSKIEAEFDVKPIKAAIMKGEHLVKLYNNLIKIGFGTQTSPYVELFHNSLRSKEYSYGLHFKHFSANGSIDGYGEPNNSHNQLNLYGRKFTKKYSLKAGINYDRKVVHYYGYLNNDYTVLPTKDDIKQRYSLIGFYTSLKNIKADSGKLDHKLDLAYYNLSDKYGTSENNVLLNANMSKDFKIFDFTEVQTGFLEIVLDYYNNKWDSLSKRNNAKLSFVPSLKTDFKEFNFEVGFDASIEIDTTSNIHFYPIIIVNANIIKNRLIATAGITGEMKKNSFKSLSDENPFVSSITPLEYSYNKFKIFGGVLLNINNDIDCKIFISSLSFDNQAFFVSDTNEVYNNKFIALYDDGNQFNFKGELSFKNKEKIHALFTFNYYTYSVDNEIKAWHKPDYDMSLAIQYNIQNKILLKANIIAYGKMYSRYFENNVAKAKENKGLFDLNLGIEYRYTKIISAFVNFNNIASSRYYKWHEYPTYKFNLLAGLTFAF